MPKDKTKVPPVDSKYIWNATQGVYINSETGRKISTNTIKNELEKVIKVSEKRMYAFSQALANGEISLADWQLAMMTNIKSIHIASAALANGGWAQMSKSDWGYVGGKIRGQYNYLKKFAQQIYTGQQPLGSGVIFRAQMYADASRNTFEEMKRRYQETENGMTEEARELGEADHCPGCLEQWKLGWQPIGTLDPIGDEECLTNCHCKFKYRRQEADGSYTYSEEE